MDDKDRELLEKAANAAGVNAMWRPNVCEGGEWFAVPVDDGWLEWNPLTDDGDALRLAVKLNLTIVNEPHECEVFSEGECVASEPILHLSMVATSAEVTAPCAATRRAIVRAAAAFGEKL